MAKFEAVIRLHSDILRMPSLDKQDQQLYALLLEELESIPIKDDVDLRKPFASTDDWLFYEISGVTESNVKELEALEKEFSSDVFALVNLYQGENLPLILKARLTLVRNNNERPVEMQSRDGSMIGFPPMEERVSKDGQYTISTGEITTWEFFADHTFSQQYHVNEAFVGLRPRQRKIAALIVYPNGTERVMGNEELLFEALEK